MIIQTRDNHILLCTSLKLFFDEKPHNLCDISSSIHLDQAYDVPTMSETLDFINVMTYDYHGWWDNHHFTGNYLPCN